MPFHSVTRSLSQSRMITFFFQKKRKRKLTTGNVKILNIPFKHILFLQFLQMSSFYIKELLLCYIMDLLFIFTAYFFFKFVFTFVSIFVNNFAPMDSVPLLFLLSDVSIYIKEMYCNNFSGQLLVNYVTRS